MKAIVFDAHGGPEMLHLSEVPEPVAGPGEILVNVRAASVNAADFQVRRGGHGVVKFPHILGRDFSGTVANCGDGVSDFKIGDEVFGVLDAGTEGAYAERLVVRSEIAALKPGNLTHSEAAALALTGLTAICAITDTGKLKRGETILVQGGAGGVAGIAIQIAKYAGATVLTTTSSRNTEYVRSIGADQLIDYNLYDFTDIGRICDVVFDTVGGSVQTRSFDILKPGGRLVWVAFGSDGALAPRNDVEVLRPSVLRSRHQLDEIVRLTRIGAIVAPAIQTFAFADAAEAHRISETRHLKGKLVLVR